MAAPGNPLDDFADMFGEAGALYTNRLSDLRGLLKAIGAVIESQAQRAFEEKKLGEKTWAAQYPGQSEPFLHIAGSLRDLAGTGNIKTKRFSRQPAGVDTGALSQKPAVVSIVDPTTVEVGSPHAYAGVFQWGGTSEIPITTAMRDRWAALVVKAERAVGRLARSRPQADPAKEAKRILRKHKAEAKFAALAKLGFITEATRKVTKSNARPFLGITDQNKQEIYESVIDYFAGDPPVGVVVEVG